MNINFQAEKGIHSLNKKPLEIWCLYSLLYQIKKTKTTHKTVPEHVTLYTAPLNCGKHYLYPAKCTELKKRSYY